MDEDSRRMLAKILDPYLRLPEIDPSLIEDRRGEAINPDDLLHYEQSADRHIAASKYYNRPLPPETRLSKDAGYSDIPVKRRHR